MIVLMPIAFAPELSIRSGGLPATKRGCSSWAMLVDGATVTFTVVRFLLSTPAANLT